MELVFDKSETEDICINLRAAKKHLGGNEVLATSLLARINALKQADTIKDIIVMPTFHFHRLENKDGRDLEGFFAIDVKSRKEPWRIILEPLDDDKQPYIPCNIDKISQNVRTVRIVEVSKHYG